MLKRTALSPVDPVLNTAAGTLSCLGTLKAILNKDLAHGSSAMAMQRKRRSVATERELREPVAKLVITAATSDFRKRWFSCCLL